MSKAMNVLCRSRNFLFIFMLLNFLTACSYIPFFSDGDSTEKEPVNKKVSDTSTPTPTESHDPVREVRVSEQIELKQAKIWARMEEIEEELRIQRERVRLLEQGLMTGIPPEELKRTPTKKSSKHPASDKSVNMVSDQKPSQHADGEHEVSEISKIEKADHEKGSEQSSNAEESASDLRVKIQVAKDYIQSSRFGLAVAELTQLQKSHGLKAGDGEIKYLLGRSYNGLREFNFARNEFESYIKEFPGGRWSGLARIELAKSYMGMNLRDRARNELSGVASEYSGKEEGDIAAGELERLKTYL